jgi:hypothetical protein
MTLAAFSPFRSGSHADHVAFAHQVKSRNFLRKHHLVAIWCGMQFSLKVSLSRTEMFRIQRDNE